MGLALFTFAALAQTSSESLSGTVLDNSGAGTCAAVIQAIWFVN